MLLKNFSNFQHAYSKGRSVETALHTITTKIEKGITFKDFTLAVFLDIEGAFNNVRPQAVVESLLFMGIDPPLVQFVKQLLTKRTIQSNLGNASIVRYASRSVLSPLLWNLTVNTLLTQLERTGCQVIAYADDIAKTAIGKHLQTLTANLFTKI